MAERNEPATDGANGPDAVGCAGSLFIFFVVLFIMGAVLTSSDPLSGSESPGNSLVTAVLDGRVDSEALDEEPLGRVSVPADPTRTLPPDPLPTATLVASPTAAAAIFVAPTVTLNHAPVETVAPTATINTELLDASAERLAAATLEQPSQAPIRSQALPTPHDVYSWTLKVPILMYHYVSTPPEDADVYRVDLSVEPERFRRQMAYLTENDYTAIDLYDLSLAIADKRPLPDRPVIITLDDGYVDNYENAFPVLLEFGLTATFFVATEFIDRGNPDYMSWPMLEEMAAAGMRIEPHSKTHPDLRGQERDVLIWQILGSQETIAAHIGYLPRYFAYPSGRYDADTIQVLQELDFWGAVTTMSGKWHGYEGRYEWTRLRVRHSTPLAEFVDLVDPGDTRGGIRQTP